MTEPTTEAEPPPVQVKATTAIVIGTTAFVAGAVVCAATYGRILKLDVQLNAWRWREVSNMFSDAVDFLEEKNLLDEFAEATGHIK